MAIRMTGLMSGLDTESIIKELMSAHTLKKTKVEQKKTKEEWKKEKWEELNTKLYALYTKQASKMKLASSYMTKKVSSSNESAVTATATTSAASGSHTVQVNQLASSQYITSGKLDGATASTKLVDLKGDDGIASMTAGTVITIKNGSTTKYLEVTESTTIKNLVSTLQEAGLNASYDETQDRLFISSKESGADNAFSITALSADSEVVTAKNALDEAASTLSASTLNTFYSNYAAAIEAGDTEKIAELEENLIEAAKEAKEAELTAAATETVAATYAAGLTETDEDYIAIQEELNEKYYTADEDGNQVYTDTIKEKAQAALKTKAEEAIEAEIEAGNVTYATDEEKEAAITAKYEDLIADEDEMAAAVQTLYDADFETAKALKGAEHAKSEAGQAEVAAIVVGQKDDIDAVGTAVEVAIADYKAAVQGDTTVGSAATAGDALADLGLIGSSVSIVEAADAEIVLDGATLTGSSNTFTAAGITFDLKDTTVTKDADGNIIDAKTVTMNVSNDVDAVYDSIKEFFKEYNSILEEMNTLYNAESARGYDPLTDEEKEAMTEEQIELWETKIKDSLLRRDTTLGGIADAMRSAMQSTVTIDGKTYSLASFGIMTSSDYTERGLLHIYGDEDDSTYADQTDKLKAALASDPDTVTEVLSGIVGKLSATLMDKMKKTSLSSALTFYNDTQIKKNIEEYEDEIDKWEDRLQEIEDRYYDQFTAMETALAKLQSQSSYLSSLMGTSS